MKYRMVPDDGKVYVPLKELLKDARLSLPKNENGDCEEGTDFVLNIIEELIEKIKYGIDNEAVICEMCIYADGVMNNSDARCLMPGFICDKLCEKRQECCSPCKDCNNYENFDPMIFTKTPCASIKTIEVKPYAEET